MRTFKNRFHEWDFKTVYVTDDTEAAEIAGKLAADTKTLYGLDIETGKIGEYEQSGLCPHISRIRLVQVYAPQHNISYVFDIYKVKLDAIAPMLRACRFVAHNGIFEIKHLTHAGYPDMNIGCSMLISQLIVGAEHSPYEKDEDDDDEDKTGLSQYTRFGHSLDYVVQRLFGVKVDKAFQTSNWDAEELVVDQITYAGLDAILTYKIATAMSPKIAEYKMVKVYQLLKDMQHVVAHMELVGLPVDWEYHANLIKGWEGKSKEAFERCTPFFGNVNMRSGKQMNEWLIGYLKDKPELLEEWPKTDKGAYTFTKTAIAAYKDLPAIGALLEYKKYAKLIDTYGQSLIEKKHPITGRLHTSYTLGETRTGRLSSRNPNCYSADTEILTLNGWVRFDCLTEGVPVASWHKDGTVTFDVPTAYHRYHYDGDLVHLHNTHTNLLVTPDHRCLVQRRRIGTFLDVAAKDYKYDFIQIHAGKCISGSLSVDPLYLQLLVATQADGHIGQYGIRFGFSKKRKIERLSCILDGMGIKYRYTDRQKKNQTELTISRHEPVYDRLTKDLIKNHQKVLPTWLLQLNPECLSIVCAEFSHWDGLNTRESTIQFCSTVEVNSDMVQALYTLNNSRVIKTLYTYNVEKHGGNFSVAYNIQGCVKRNHSYTTNIVKDVVHYSGYVYCVTVPSSYVIVRRAGKVVVSGNCQNYPRDKEFRDMFIAQPGHVIVVSDFSQIELRLQSEFSKDPQMRKVYKEKQDIYKTMASVVYGLPTDKIDKAKRFVGKTIMLALGYGMGAKKLNHYAVNAGVHQEQEFWDAAWKTYHTTFTTYSQWCDSVRRRAKGLGYIDTLLGKRRKLSQDEMYTRAPNTVIQGSAAELMMTAMLLCYAKVRSYGQLVATVHDEILLHVPEDRAEEATEHLASSMNDAMKQMFPNAASHEVADAAAGKRWGEVKAEL